MPVKAFVLIQTEVEVAKTPEVLTALKELRKEIKSVDCVTEPYDIIVVVEAGTLDEIATLVDNKIQAVAGVYRTVTCVSI